MNLCRSSERRSERASAGSSICPSYLTRFRPHVSVKLLKIRRIRINYLDRSHTKLTDIDEAIILRKATRLGSGFRERLDTVAGRREARQEFVEYYDGHPLSLDCFKRVVMHLNLVFPPSSELDESTVLERGYF
jgi:hypothetical protein